MYYSTNISIIITYIARAYDDIFVIKNIWVDARSIFVVIVAYFYPSNSTYIILISSNFGQNNKSYFLAPFCNDYRLFDHEWVA